MKDPTFGSVDPKQVDDFLIAKMKSLEIPGISIAIVHRGQIVHKNSYGLANVEHAASVTPQSPFEIASLTKPITAIAIIQLMEHDLISLDKPASYYLDDLPREWNTITVRQLLSHTSSSKQHGHQRLIFRNFETSCPRYFNVAKRHR